MQASSLTTRLKRGMVIRDWTWSRLPPLPRGYVAFVVILAVAAIGVGAARTAWRVDDALEFLLLACCGTISMASTPRIVYRVGGATRDFSTMWALPTAIVLPPVYAALIAIPIVATLYLYVHPGQLYRRVFSAASLSLSYIVVSLVFRAFPNSIAGSAVGSGLHAFTWCFAVCVCELLGCRIQHFLIVGAVKMSNPSMRFFAGEFDRNALQELFVEIDLGILVTVAVALSPILVVIALPTVLLVRRFLVHPVLVAQSRVDSKTGLLNVSTWESEAETELSRASRMRHPLALALIDIDHFKIVNDTHGHLVGDRVLKAVAQSLTSQSRDYDRAGRFGGEEFVLLLAQTAEADALKIAERLRAHVEGMAVSVDDRPDSPTVKVTISIGVTAIARGETRELTDLLAAADSALYHAKQNGRNRISAAPSERNMGLDAFNADLAAAPRPQDDLRPVADPHPAPATQSPRVVQVHVQANPTPLSLCQNRSLSVPAKPHHDSDSLK